MAEVDYWPKQQCALCHREFQFGHHRYDGRHIPQWNVYICEWCEAGNADGIQPHQHQDLINDLRARGVVVQLNSRGWLPIPRGF